MGESAYRPVEPSAVAVPLSGVVIGSGAVASAVAPALERSGKVVWKQVYSPNIAHAQWLADELTEALAIDNPRLVIENADIYLIAVRDDAIASLVPELPRNNAVWMHTSGGVPAEVLRPLSPNYGVFYPLQTFSKGVDVDMSRVPLFVEGSNDDTEHLISSLAHGVSGAVRHADTELRKRLHCAAVFACNFTNHLWAVADKILREQPGLDITFLEPLLRETLRKAMTVAPEMAQTGPARRGDTAVMERHKALLSPDDAELYDYISKRIMKHYEFN